jgi:hypothetical protein
VFLSLWMFGEFTHIESSKTSFLQKDFLSFPDWSSNPKAQRILLLQPPECWDYSYVPRYLPQQFYICNLCLENVPEVFQCLVYLDFIVLLLSNIVFRQDNFVHALFSWWLFGLFSLWAVRTSVAVTVPVTLMCGTMFSVLLAVSLACNGRVTW